jgi:hypothetical protein
VSRLSRRHVVKAVGDAFRLGAEDSCFLIPLELVGNCMLHWEGRILQSNCSEAA